MEKIKVMIVDDDRLAVDYLKHLLDWGTLGCEVTCIAYNGKQALHLFQQMHPQIVITDIRMPLMDGIELIREIKKRSPETRTVLSTAYGEFAYARAAIQEGVDAYLMKDEVNVSTLTKTLSELCGMLVDIKKVSDILFQKAVVDFFHIGEAYVQEIYQDKAIQRLLQSSYYYVLIQQDFPLVGESNAPEKPRTAFELMRSCLKAEKPGLQAIQYGGIAQSKVLFLYEGTGDDQETAVKEVCDAMCAALCEEFSARFTGFYLSRKMQLKELYPFLKDALVTRQWAAENGTGKVYPLLHLGYTTCKCERSGLDERGYRRFYEMQDQQGYEACITALTDAGNLSAVRRALQLNAQILETLYGEQGMQQARQILTRAYDLQETQSLLLAGFQQFLEWESQACGERFYSPEVRGAMEWIRTRYSDKALTISQIADKVEMSASRLSVVFKSSTGKTINQYLTEVRIHQAKNLLEHGTMRVYQVAERVGYGNSQYLSQIFHKETGYYPGEYKKRKK